MTVNSLSSPFMDARSACGFFDFILGLFVEGDPAAAAKLIGIVIDFCAQVIWLMDLSFSVLDEAHKVMTIIEYYTTLAS